MITLIYLPETRRGGRVDKTTGLENRRASRLRGFESHPLRQFPRPTVGNYRPTIRCSYLTFYEPLLKKLNASGASPVNESSDFWSGGQSYLFYTGSGEDYPTFAGKYKDYFWIGVVFRGGIGPISLTERGLPRLPH